MEEFRKIEKSFGLLSIYLTPSQQKSIIQSLLLRLNMSNFMKRKFCSIEKLIIFYYKAKQIWLKDKKNDLFWC